MIKLYNAGILVGKFKSGPTELLDPYRNEFIDIEDMDINEEFLKRYKIKPRHLINSWDEMQDLIDEAIAKSSDYFVTKDELYYEKNDDIWVQRKTMEPIDIITKENSIIGFVKVDRSSCSVLVQEGNEEYTPLSQYSNIPSKVYAVEDRGDYMIRMRDGIHLSTKILMPKGKDTAPVILYRTPYGKNNYVQSNLQFIQRGYGVVIQDTRGREDSEGEWFPCLYEMNDGDDTLTWIGESEFCDGNVGMIGGSYSGYVQWAAAASSNPYLKAIVSIVTSGSPFTDLPYKGGCLMSGVLAWVFAMSDKKINPALMQRDDWDELLKVRPISKIVEAGLNREVPYWNEWCKSDIYSDFWDKQNWYAKRNQMKDIPTFILSGWYDDNNMGTTEAIDVINDRAFSNYKIILGPWLHKANSARDINNISLGKDALRYDIDYEYLMWFEEHLKGVHVDRINSVEYYDVGKQTWETSMTWPPGKNKRILTLKDDLNAVGEYTPYTYDPSDPAPHIIDISTNEASPPGDYQNIEKRKDVLTFSTDILNEDITVAGDIVVNFYASSDCLDTDWVVRITDVDEKGRSIKVAENMLRAKFRHGYDRPELLIEDTVYNYEIRTSKIATTFKKGHKIRFMITSSALGYIFENTNTGNNPSLDSTFKIAHQRIYHSKDYNSYIELPIV